jgi:hypothetical protein
LAEEAFFRGPFKLPGAKMLDLKFAGDQLRPPGVSLKIGQEKLTQPRFESILGIAGAVLSVSVI